VRRRMMMTSGEESDNISLYCPRLC
jgi:hypothetical protein